jgi:hypothetical protein
MTRNCLLINWPSLILWASALITNFPPTRHMTLKFGYKIEHRRSLEIQSFQKKETVKEENFWV